MTRDQIVKAGSILKVLRLVGLPGMDTVAVKLNCGLTWEEEVIAKKWARAFELAQTGEPLFDCAAKLHEEFR